MSTALAGLIVGMHLVSVHDVDGFNDVNPGAYVRHASGLTAGVLVNSERRTSAYAGYTLESSGGTFALTLGAVTGYREHRVLPLVTPSVRIELADGFAARIAYLPKPPRIGRAQALHLMVERRF